jgi:NAD(P)-dependent dehydrogenase (short-subunit alcohol dehydrogenase family)
MVKSILEQESPMPTKTIVVTGGTSGIGEVAAIRLAEQGARIVLIARDRARADTTLAKLNKANPAATHAVHLADLSSIAEMKRVAAEVAAAEPAIDVLINNAGAVFTSRQESVDGLEMTFAVNHMAYFVVTNILLPNLKATPGARIVSTASMAHSSGKIDFDDLQLRKSYSTFRAYGNSKLMNILFTRELARRLEGAGVTANCLHPGGVATRFGSNNSGFLAVVFKVAISIAGISPEKGARTIIHLASSPDVATISGEYFYKCKVIDPSAAAQSDEDAKRLWDASAKIAGVG